MRLMSVAFTEDAVRSRTKTVTRRKGWTFAKPGDRVTLCRKVMGRKKGEPLERLVDVELVDVRREPLGAITKDDVAREGFPGMGPVEFIDKFFVQAQRMTAFDEVTRVEWRYLTYYVEMYDATWGGWHKVRASDLTDEPATFATLAEAEAVLADLRARSAYEYRIKEG